jgi:CBS domain-containing protein
MYNVRQVLQKKGSEVWAVTPQTSTLDALNMMAEKDIGALLVIEAEKVAGIISERDFARQIPKIGSLQLNSPVEEIMTRDVIAVGPEKTIEDCMALMTANRIRHLPVVEDDRLIGMISIGDVVKSLIEDREDLIQNLENYILGTGYGR